MRKLNISVIREEYFHLCSKKHMDAIVLNQMIYWSERVKDFDSFISEENIRIRNNGELEIELTSGWIYKSAEELITETMIDVTKVTMLKILNRLVEFGFIERRNNPKYKWDHTYQYRVSLYFIAEELSKLGYVLPSYKVNIDVNKMNIVDSNNEFRRYKKETTIPETTAKTTLEITNKDKPVGLIRHKKSIDHYIINKYNKIFNRKIISTDKRKKLILKTVKERGLKTLVYAIYGMKNDPWINKIDGTDLEDKIGLKRLIDPGKRDANIDKFAKFPFNKKYKPTFEYTGRPATKEDFENGDAF